MSTFSKADAERLWLIKRELRLTSINTNISPVQFWSNSCRYHNSLSLHIGIKQTSTQCSRLSFRKSCMVPLSPPLVQQKPHPAELSCEQEAKSLVSQSLSLSRTLWGPCSARSVAATLLRFQACNAVFAPLNTRQYHTVLLNIMQYHANNTTPCNTR